MTRRRDSSGWVRIVLGILLKAHRPSVLARFLVRVPRFAMLASSHQGLPQACERAAAIVDVHAELRGRHGRHPCQSWLRLEDALNRLMGKVGRLQLI